MSTALTFSTGGADYTKKPNTEKRGADASFPNLHALGDWLGTWSHPTTDRTNKGPFWCPFQLSPGSRAGQAPLWCVLVLDYDHGAPPVTLNAYERIIYESRSSTPEVPRSRVIVSVSRPLIHTEAMRLARHFGADTNACKPTQIFWGRKPGSAVIYRAGA